MIKSSLEENVPLIYAEKKLICVGYHWMIKSKNYNSAKTKIFCVNLIHKLSLQIHVLNA